MSIFIKPGVLKVRDDNDEFSGINIMAEESSQNYLAAIQNKGEEVMDAIEEKGEDTIDSIPSDYTALENEVEGLKEDFNKLIKIKPLAWEQGTLSSTTGEKSVNANRVRTPDWLDCKDYDTIVCDTSLYLNVFFYSAKASGSSGFLSSTEFITTGHSYNIRDNLPTGAKYFKVCLRYASGTSVAITPSDISSQTTYAKQLVTNDLQNQIAPIPFNDINDICAIEKYIAVNSSNSGACFASHDGTVQRWTFVASADDHQTDAAWYRLGFDPNTLEFTSASSGGRHTLGHVNSCSYNEEKDAFVCGNGSDDYNLSGEIIIIESAFAKTNFYITDALVIPFANYGSKVNAVWGDASNILFITTNDGYDLYKILLGEGTVELESGILQKTTGFNGTFKIIGHWEYGDKKKDYDNVVQGMFYYNKRIYWGFGHYTGIIPLHWVEPLTNGDVKTGGVNYYTYNDNGSKITRSICSGTNYKNHGVLVFSNATYMIDLDSL